MDDLIWLVFLEGRPGWLENLGMGIGIGIIIRANWLIAHILLH